jgi:hypothetical protein
MARGKRSKKVGKKISANGRRRGRRVGVAGALGIVANLTAARADLVAQHRALDQQIVALDRALAALGSRAPGRPVARGPGRRARARRGRRAGSLKDYIAKVLAGKKGPMAVKDITGAVLGAGYTSKNKTLAKSIGIALTQMPDAVKVGRGLFRAK